MCFCLLLSHEYFLISQVSLFNQGFKNYLFIFACAGSLLLCGLLSRCGARAFSCCEAQALGCAGLGSCSSQALELGSVVVAQVLSCFVSCGIFLDQGLNLCPLYLQMDSLPLGHWGSPLVSFFDLKFILSNIYTSTNCISVLGIICMGYLFYPTFNLLVFFFI